MEFGFSQFVFFLKGSYAFMKSCYVCVVTCVSLVIVFLNIGSGSNYYDSCVFRLYIWWRRESFGQAFCFEFYQVLSFGWAYPNYLSSLVVLQWFNTHAPISQFLTQKVPLKLANPRMAQWFDRRFRGFSHFIKL